MENSLKITSIDGFNSYEEFDRFQQYIIWLIAEDMLEMVEKGQSPVTQFFGISEVWYADNDGQIWVLVAPDFPAKGFFLRLQDIH